MPNFEVGGIDVLAEPIFTGFARTTKERLTEIERQIEPFNVEAEPKLVKDFRQKLELLVAKAQDAAKFDIEGSPALVKDFKARLEALVFKAQSSAKFDIEGSPALVKDFVPKLEALVAKAQGSAKFDIEGSPALTKDFRARLEALAAKASDGVRFDIEFTPALSKTFKKELQLEAAKAQEGVHFDVEATPALGKGFKTRLRELVRQGQSGVEMKIEARPALIAGFKTDLRELVKGAAEFASTAVEFRPNLASGFKTELREKIAAEGPVEVNARLRFANKAQLRAQLKEAIDAAAEGLQVRVHVLLDPMMTEFKEMLKAGLATTNFKARVRPDTTDLGAELKAGIEKAKAGVKAISSVTMRIKTIGGRALEPIIGSLKRIGSLAKTATFGFGLLAAGITLAGAVGVKQSGEFQFQQLGLQALLQSNTKGAEIFQGLLKQAKETPFEVKDLAPTIKQLHGAGIATKDLLPDLKILSDLAAVLGRSGTNMAKVGIALAKIQGKGKITAREFNSISENFPGFQAMQAIATEMGITVPQAFEKMKTGAIPADKAIRGLIKGMKAFPGANDFAAKSATKTLQGALTNFPDLVRISFFQAFQKNLPQITKFLGVDGPIFRALNVVLKVVSDSFVPVADAVLNMIADLTPAIGALVTSAIPLTTALAKGIGALSPALVSIGKAFRFVFDPLAKVLPGVVSRFAKLLQGVVDSSQGAFKALGGGIKDLVTGFFTALGTLAPIVGPILRLLGLVGTTLGKVLPVLAKNLAPVLAAAAPVLAKVITLVGKLFIAFAPIARQIALIAVKLVNKLIPAFKPLTSKSFLTALGGVVKALGGVLGFVADMVTPMVKLAVPLLTVAGAFLSIKGVLPALIAGFLTYKAVIIVLNTIEAIRLALATGNLIAMQGTALAIAGIVTVAVLLAIGIYQLYKKWKPFHDLVDTTWQLIKRFRLVLLGLVGAFVTYTAVTWLASFAVDAYVTSLFVMDVALTVATGAAEAFSLALAANPVGAVIVGLVLLGLALFALYKNFKPFHDLVDATWQFIKRNLIPIIGFVTAVLATGGIALLGGAIFALYKNFKILRTIFDPVGRFFRDLPGRVVGAALAVGRFFTNIGSTALRFGKTFARDVGGAFESVVRFFQLLPGRIVHIFSQLPGQVERALQRFGPTVLHAIGFALGAALGLLVLWPLLIVRAFVRFGPVVARAVGNFLAPIAGLVGTLLDTIGRGVVTGLEGIGHGVVIGLEAVGRAVVIGLDAVGRAVVTGLDAVGRFVVSGLDKLGRAVVAVLDLIGREVLRLPGQIARALSALGNITIHAITVAMGAVGRAVQTGVRATLGFFARLPGQIGRALGHLDRIMHDAAAAGMRGIDRGFRAGAGAVLRFFVRFGPDLINGLGRGLKNAAVGLFRAARILWHGFVDGFKAVLGIHSPSTVMEGLGHDVILGLLHGIERFAGRIVSFFTGLPGRMIRGMGRIGNAFFDVGHRVVEGIINGIGRFAGGLYDKAKSLASKVLGILTGPIGFLTGSESKKTRAIGKDVADGLSSGIEKGTPAVVLKATRLGQQARAGLEAGIQANNPVTLPDVVTNSKKRKDQIAQQRLSEFVNAAQQAGAGSFTVARPKGTGFKAAAAVNASGLKGNDFSDLGTSKVAQGVTAIARQFGTADRLITASQARMRDHIIREWIKINSGTNEQAQRWVATLNGKAIELEDAQDAHAKTIRDTWLLAYVQLHGGTVQQAKQWIAAQNAATSGHVLTQEQQATKLRITWVREWQRIHGGSLAEADALFRETHTKTDVAYAADARKNQLHKEAWIAQQVALGSGTVAQVTKMYDATFGQAEKWRAAVARNNAQVRSNYITEYIKIHHSTLDEAIRSYNDHAAEAKKGGEAIGKALADALNRQRFLIAAAMLSYGRDLRGALNPVLGGLGLPEIKDGAVQVAVAGHGHTNNKGGVVYSDTVGLGGPNRDQVLTYLTPREYVVQRPRVDEQGLHKLTALNEGKADIVYRKYRPERHNTGGLVGAQALAGGGPVTGLNPEFLKRFLAWTGSLGNKFSIGSGFRSMAQQQVLYDRWIHHVPGQAKAAKPGTSMHEFGLAIDHVPSTHTAADAAAATRFKLYYPMSFEPWHIQPIGIGRSAGGVSAPGAIGGVALPHPPKLTGAPWLDAVANGEMNKTFLLAQQWVDQHTEAAPTGGGLGSALSSFFGNASGSLLGRVMAAIERHESGGNPRAQNPTSSASGLYQVLRGTWNNYAGYPTAASAPPSIQDNFAASHMGPVLSRYNNDPGAVAAYWFVNDPNRRNDASGPVHDFVAYVRNLSQHIAGVPGYENGGIFRKEDVIRVAERGKAEVVIPLTKPARAQQLADQSGLTGMLAKGGKQITFAEGSIVIQIVAPTSESPESYASSIAHRVTPALAAAVERALH